MKRLPAAAVVAALALAAGCGGGGQSGSVPAAGNGPSTAIPFAFTVAASSSVTKIGVASSAVTGSPETDVSLAAGSANCATAGTTRTCNATLTLPSGAQTLAITTYGARTTRSSWQTTLDGSRVALSVGTAIAQISLNLAATSLAGGSAGSTTLYVTARDANGNTIVGDLGGATIALASNDTTGAVTLASTTIATGTAAVTVAYSGSGAVQSVTFDATSSGVASTAIVDATLAFTSSTLMYVAAGNAVLAFADGISGDATPVQRIVFPGETLLTGAVPDGQGHVLVGVDDQSITHNSQTVHGARIAQISSTQPAQAIASPTYPYALPAQTIVTDFTVGSNGTLYILGLNASAGPEIFAIPAGATSPTQTITLPGALSSGSCNAIAVAPGATTLAINCVDASVTTASIDLFPGNASGATTPMQITGAATTLHPTGIGAGVSYLAYGSDASLVTNDVDASYGGHVLIFAPGASGNVAPAREIAGAGTGLNPGAFLSEGNAVSGIGIDPSGAIYVAEFGSQSPVQDQVLRFAPGANGAAIPASVLGGPLTYLTGVISCALHFTSGVVPAVAATPPSVSGDFLSVAPNRTWNYSVTQPGVALQTPAPPYTLSINVNPNPAVVAPDTEIDAYAVAGTVPTAVGASGAYLAAQAIFSQGTGEGWYAAGYVPVSSGASIGGFIPIPGGIKLVPTTLALGQTYLSYLGLTASVVSIGTVPGSSACPGGAAPGAIVSYAFGSATETVGYVAGCGITFLISDLGATATLQSITTESAPSSVANAPLSTDGIATLRALWHGTFTPWRAR